MHAGEIEDVVLVQAVLNVAEIGDEAAATEARAGAEDQRAGAADLEVGIDAIDGGVIGDGAAADIHVAAGDIIGERHRAAAVGIDDTAGVGDQAVESDFAAVLGADDGRRSVEAVSDVAGDHEYRRIVDLDLTVIVEVAANVER